MFRNRLINYSRKFRIQFEDLEEIVNDAIFKAWKYFDNDRGSFESLCIVIIKNKILNFRRGNVYLILLVFIDENEEIISSEDVTFEESEKIEMSKKYISKLKNRLTEEELALFNEIYNIRESSNNISISKAAINIGLTLLKGWDLFRKIQRKAKLDKTVENYKIIKQTISKELEDFVERKVSEMPKFFYCKKLYIDSEKYLDLLLRRFSEDDLVKLNSIYDY